LYIGLKRRGEGVRHVRWLVAVLLVIGLKVKVPRVSIILFFGTKFLKAAHGRSKCVENYF